MKMQFGSFFCLAILITGSALAADDPGRPTARLIELGWDIPSTQFIRENAESMQVDSPFDGIMYEVAPAEKQSSQGMCDATPWDPADYDICIEDMNAAGLKQFRENFIRVNFSPGTLAWNDDTGWKVFCDKVGICAKIAKNTPSRGIAPDFESYGKPMFQYDVTSGLSLAESRELAFQRGRQFIGAVAAEYPNAVILALWLNSINMNYVPRAGSIDSVYTQSSYGLLPDFVSGMLDAAPPEMVLVDGCESGYYYQNSSDYFKSALNMISWSGPGMALIRPELRAKYRAQVQAGFGLYLDMFTNPKGNVYYREAEEGGTRLDRFCKLLDAAMEASDGYIWVYGEKHRWWNVERGKNKLADFADETDTAKIPSMHWEDALPGLSLRMCKLRDPLQVALKRWEQAQNDPNLTNLLLNSDFSARSEGNALPDSWGTWQIDPPRGTFSLVSDGADGAPQLCISGVRNGCFIQSVPVKSGEEYCLACQARIVGNGEAGISARWQTADGKWVCEVSDCQIPFGASVREKSGMTAGLVRVPDGAERLVVLLSAYSQMTEKDCVFFDHPCLYREGE